MNIEDKKSEFRLAAEEILNGFRNMELDFENIDDLGESVLETLTSDELFALSAQLHLRANPITAKMLDEKRPDEDIISDADSLLSAAFKILDEEASLSIMPKCFEQPKNCHEMHNAGFVRSTRAYNKLQALKAA